MIWSSIYVKGKKFLEELGIPLTSKKSSYIAQAEKYKEQYADTTIPFKRRKNTKETAKAVLSVLHDFCKGYSTAMLNFAFAFAIFSAMVEKTESSTFFKLSFGLYITAFIIGKVLLAVQAIVKRPIRSEDS